MTPQQMLERLVGFETVSRDSNLALIDFVAQYLEDHGATTKRIENADGTKANLYASVGPQRAGGVVLSGHTDVVPVDGQAWDTEPFVLTQTNGRWYGRGTCDMKAFSAIGLALVPQMQRLEYPLHFALSYDEEVGCLGAPSMIADMARELPPTRAVIVGEPTMMRVVTAHKGILCFETRVTGFESHSSLQHIGVSAVTAAARLVTWLDDRQRELAAQADPTNGFTPAYTTIHSGMISGGTAANITARRCRFITDIRALPTDDARAHLDAYLAYVNEELLPALRATSEAAAEHVDVAVNVLSDVPGLQADPDSEAVRLAQSLTGQNTTVAEPYAAEAGQFQAGGFSAVLCGPGSIEQAHQPNEYISNAQMAAGQRFVEDLIKRLSR